MVRICSMVRDVSYTRIFIESILIALLKGRVYRMTLFFQAALDISSYLTLVFDHQYTHRTLLRQERL
jgi:hypothetical protein